VFLVVAVCLLATPARAEGEKGAVGGTIRAEGNGPVAGAEVTATLDGGKWTARTDAAGAFTLELPAGMYRMVVSHPDYDERTLLNVEVVPGKRKQADITLHRGGTGASAGGIEEMVVTGRYEAAKLEDPRFSASLVDALSKEDFQVTGDSGVVDALARVTGVTIVDDKYVYVRGLGERYSSTLFNNAMLPSPDPSRRVVPLDLFPSGVMEQLSVTKTYAPHLPADFSGGSLALTTREIPSDEAYGFKVAVEQNTQTTYRDVLWPEGDDLDWTGFEGGFRDLPGLINELSPDGNLTPGNLTDEQIRAVGQALNRNYDLDNLTIPPNVTLNGSYGNTYDFKGPASLGILIGGRYENDWQFTREQRRTSWLVPDPSGSGKLVSGVKDTLEQEETDNTISYAALATAELNLNDDQSLSTTFFYTRLTDKRYIETVGFLAENAYDISSGTWEWEERQLWSTQVVGDHHFDHFADLDVDWGVTYANANRQKPDSRYYEYVLGDDGQYQFQPAQFGNSRDWEDLNDDTWDFFFDGAIPVEFHENLRTTFKAGTKYFHKDRDSEVRRFFYLNAFDPDEFDAISRLPPGGVFDDDNIGPDEWELYEQTQYTDSYTAEEEIVAGYVATDSEIFTDWRLMIGTRYEDSTQRTETRAPTGGSPVTTELSEAYPLPAVTLTWSFLEDMQLRAAYSQTINRPDIREISPAAYLDPVDRDVYVGNPDLEIAEIDNYDLAWQWYYTEEDSIEVGGFYKDFSQPIEETLLTRGSTLLRTYENAESAVLYGIEVSQRQSLAPLGDWGRWFYYKANGAWIDSEVEIDQDNITQTNDKRPLQGQSPWVVNLQLTYDSLPRDIQATLAFNMAGERITDVGVNGLDDAYEQPVPRLDFIYGQGFQLWGQFMRAGVRVKNIIDPKYVTERDSVNEREYREGTSFELSFEMEF
jgi:outer membrane receptor protein involved in Fe transport